MLYYTLSQSREFAAMTVAGAAMGALALVFAALRRLIRPGTPGTLLCDCVMGAAWAAIAALALTAACRGDARLYHFLAMASGGALFMGAASPAARAFSARLAALCRRALSRVSASRAARIIFK